MQIDLDKTKWLAPVDKEEEEIKCVGCSYETYAGSCGHVKKI